MKAVVAVETSALGLSVSVSLYNYDVNQNNIGGCK